MNEGHNEFLRQASATGTPYIVVTEGIVAAHGTPPMSLERRLVSSYAEDSRLVPTMSEQGSSCTGQLLDSQTFMRSLILIGRYSRQKCFPLARQ